MPDDLPRIGAEPDCEFPGCLLIGRTRTWIPALGEHRILCSVHDDWDWTNTIRAALRGDGSEA